MNLQLRLPRFTVKKRKLVKQVVIYAIMVAVFNLKRKIGVVLTLPLHTVKIICTKMFMFYLGMLNNV